MGACGKSVAEVFLLEDAGIRSRASAEWVMEGGVLEDCGQRRRCETAVEGLDSIPLHHRSPWWCCGTLIKTWEHKRPQRKKKTASGEEFFSKQGKKKKRTSELNREGSKKLSEISRRENVQGRMTHYIRVWITESYLNLTFISFWFCDQKQITQHH